MQFLTKEELAKILKVKPTSIDRYRKEGFKPVIKNPLRFTLEDFLEWENSKRDK